MHAAKILVLILPILIPPATSGSVRASAVERLQGGARDSVATAGTDPIRIPMGVRVPIKSMYRERAETILAPGQTKLELGRSFLISGSDSVIVDGRILRREEEYRINLLKGSIILVTPAAGGERAEVSWLRYHFPFLPVFASRLPGDSPAMEVTIPAFASQPDEKEKERGQYNLRVSGMKTVGFSVGSNRDLGIDQNLKVTLAGKLAKDLEIKAFLSDDDLPVQPEGNTEELRHLDKVYVQVKSRHSEVQLGDLVSGLEWSRFSSFERELRGISAGVTAAGHHLFGSAGLAKGRFRTTSFMGREGIQGPYELLDPRRFNGVVILPGTEKVYLDGRELTRGSENDYTIDYNRGTVTFMERTPISRDSEVVIDYQMGEDDYQRTTVTAGWTAPFFSDALSLRTYFFREGDDPDEPVRKSISDEEYRLIAAAGDDPSKAAAAGIEEVVDAEDAYIIVESDTMPPHFIFTETGGAYRLSFYEAGSGKGDYEPDGFTRRGEVKYAYAGEGKGSYRIGRLLPLPERKTIFTAGARAKKGSLYLDMEGDLSRYDRNILSGTDDGDNEGTAVKVEGGLDSLRISSTDLSLKGEYSMLQDRFVSPDKTRDPYFYRNWNLEDVALVGREEISGLSLNWKKDGLWSLAGGVRRLTRGGGVSAGRRELDLVLGDPSARGLRIGAFDSKTGDERDRRYARLQGALAFWHVVPGIDFDAERYRSFVPAAQDTGRYYYRSTVSLAGRDIGNFRTALAYSMRRTDDMSVEGGAWSRSRESDEIRLDAGYNGASRIIELFLTHRENREIASGAESTFDLARIRMKDSWQAAGISSDISYRISSGEDRRLEKAVIFVGENEGDYDSEGREVGQKRGDYMVLYLPGGDVQTVRSVELTWHTSMGMGLRGIDAGNGSGGVLGVLRRNISVDHFFSVVEKSQSDELWRLYRLDPSILQRDDVTIYGKNSLRQEWNFLNDVDKYNLKLSYLREDEEDNRSGDISTERYAREIKVRAEVAAGKSLTLSAEGGSGFRKSESQSPGEQIYRIRSLSGANILAYRLNPSTRLSLELAVEKRREELSTAEQISYMAVPSVNSSIGRNLNLSAFMKVTYTDILSDAPKPLFFLEEGLREDWNLNGQYRFTKNISFGLNYTGRREKDFTGEVKTIHALKMESRAYF